MVRDRIEHIGNLAGVEVKKRINAKGLVVAPGFINAHSYAIVDVADWHHPDQYAQGMAHVLVNGVFALEHGEMTGNINDRFIPHKGGRYVRN